METLDVIKYAQPVCFMPTGDLLCYRNGTFFLYNEKNQEQKKISISIPEGKHIFGSCKPIYRFFRLGIRCAIPVSDESFIAYLENRFYEVDLNTGKVSRFSSPQKGIRPLQFVEICEIKKFKNGIYFGGYLSNSNKNEVQIFRKCEDGNWDTVYRFRKGEINHIHALVPDARRSCVWILTGDFDEAAGIWKATDGFRSVEKILAGDQIYRACVAFPVEDGLLYATDSQLVRNSIRLLTFENGKYTSKHLCDINGSCIYGTIIGGTYYFATSVEGVGIYKNLWHFLFDCEKGPGIKDYNMYIYAGTVTKGFNIIYSQPKDRWPFSFQFGAFQFPSGINNSDKLVFRQVATKKNDLATVILSKI